VKRELSPTSRLPLFALAVVIAVAVVALLFVLDPTQHQERSPKPARSAPPAVVYGGSFSPASASPPRPAAAAVAVGLRFLRLYAQLQSRPLGPSAAVPLRALSTLALAHTLLAQPPLPAGGAHSPARVVRVRAERLSSSAVLLHAAVRHFGALPRVRCLVQRDRGRWTVTTFTAAA
jgi:hypothetical protein